jgi:hypothetical protein
MKIGIFWIYKNTVIGKAHSLDSGEQSLPGLIDSPYNHIDLWENTNDFILPFPELRRTEYQIIARGRVIYSTKDKITLVYMDASLHNKKSKALIKEFFELAETKVKWLKDPHYTTDINAIDEYFDND